MSNATHPAPTSLALRSAVQGMPFRPFATASFDAQQVAGIQEISKGYPVSNADFSQALHSQQLSMADDLRELGFTEAASRIEDRLSAAAVNRPREH